MTGAARPPYNPSMASDDARVVAVNRRARHDFDIEETFEAGLVLTGTEIKSVRAGRVNLRDSYARVEDGELWLHNMHISAYEPGSRDNVDPTRRRKLLMHGGEIARLIGKTVERGLTLVPLKVYLSRGYAKVTLGLARGRRLYDKRRAIAEREMEREQAQAQRARQKQ